jgi:hypothetical protein
MGLLDDAIRDHLELKRRRGADPGEVAREQREALDAEFEPTPEQAGPDLVAPSAAVAGRTTTTGVLDDELVAGETAELDMSTVLSEDQDVAAAVADLGSLEFELPDLQASPRADEAPPS